MEVDRFKKLFLPCHEKLYRIAFRLTGNREDAEDILQETYLKLWNRRDSLNGIANAEAYAVGVLKNACYDFFRTARDAIGDEELENLNEPAAVSLSEQIERKDEARQLKALIHRLPDQQRRVIWLHDVDDRSPEEIEQLTGLNAVNIRVTLSRARKKIREQFKRWTNEEDN